MAITPVCYVEEEELSYLRSLANKNNDDVERGLEEDFGTLLSLAAKLQDEEILSPQALVWAEDLEATAARGAQAMAALAEDIRRGVAVLALRPGEEAVVEALRKHAASTDARRADAEALAAATRRLQEKDLRRLAAQEHLVNPGVMVILKCMPEDMDSSLEEEGFVPTPEDVAAVEEMDSEVAWIEQRMVRLAARLRRGAAAFAARHDEEALVAALHRQAASADAIRALAVAFKVSVGRYRAAAGKSHNPTAEAGGQQ